MVVGRTGKGGMKTAFDRFVKHDAICLGFDFHLHLCFFTFSVAILRSPSTIKN